MKRALVTPAVAERFWARVAQEGDCWVWTGAKVGIGYGHFAQGGHSKMILAHRWSYEAMVAEIPAGLTIDHLCRNTSCVNPSHLEPVTQAENTRRNPNAVNNTGRLVTRCPQGHEYDEGNTRWRNGSRHCRACARIHSANYRARKAAA